MRYQPSLNARFGNSASTRARRRIASSTRASSRTARRTRRRTRAVSLLCHPVREQHRVLGEGILTHTDKVQGQGLVRDIDVACVLIDKRQGLVYCYAVSMRRDSGGSSVILVR